MSKLAKATFGLMVVTMLSKVLGLAREMVLTYAYGTSMQADAYITAMSIPEVLFTAIGSALATTFIPLYNENNSLEGEKGSLKFTNNIMNIVILLCLFISVLGVVFAVPLVKLFAIEFEGEKLQLTVNFARILIPSMIFVGLKNLMVSYLQIKGSFVATGLVGFPYNIIVIIAILLSVKANIYILPIATFIGIISQFLILYIFSRKKGYKYELYVSPKEKYIKKMIWLIGPVFIGVAVNQLNSIVDKSLASTLGDGVITALNTANRLNGFVMGLFIATIVTVVYPMLSKLSTEKDDKKFADTVSKSVNTIIMLLLPISVGAIVLSVPIVKVLFQRGEFNSYSTYLTSSSLVFFSIGMIGFGLRDILGKVFYSLQDTKTPMLNGAIAVSSNIVLSLLLIKPMGHRGIAFATSLSGIIGILLLFYNLKKKIGYFGQDKIISTTAKSLVSSIIMGIVIYLSNKSLNYVLGVGTIEETINLALSITIGMIIYGVFTLILKIEEVDIVVKMVKKKIKK